MAGEPFSRACIREMIKLYKELPCLWNRGHDDYNDKNAKHEALRQITQIVQKYQPEANRVHVMRKIESLRACHRKERRKVYRTANYKPKLWYYDLLSFLNGPGRIGKGSRRNDGDESEEKDQNSDEMEEPEEEMIFNNDEFSIGCDNVDQSLEIQMPYHKAMENLSAYPINPRDPNKQMFVDEYDAIGVNVAAKLRNLPQNMRILAEKMINDVLYQAQVNTLTPDTTIGLQDPFKGERS